MKKIILGLVALTTIAVSNAQGGLGIQAGVNFSNVTGKGASGTKIKAGLQGGINYNVPNGNKWVTQLGLYYIQKGFRAGTLISDGDGNSRFTFPYLQLPITFLFRPEFVDGSKMILGAGPYMAYGVGKVKYSENDFSTTDKWTDVENEGTINRYDVGAKIIAGYEMNNGLSLNINGDLGLTKFLKERKTHTTAFGLTLGYRFK